MKKINLVNKLNKDQIKLLETFTQACRHSILQMVTNAQSGHPGGSLGMVDYLALLYTQIIGQTGEKVIVSNGHVSPAVYSVLAEMGYINKADVVKNFRKAGSKYEGHVTRHVSGVWYGTGPLGAGVSAAAGFALAEKLTPSGSASQLSLEGGAKTVREPNKVFATVGDGESEEGQVYEMMNFAAKYKLDNLIVFMDYNYVQLTDSLEEIMPIDPKEIWLAAGWQVIEVDGHDFQDMWRGINKAYKVKNKPVLLLGKTVMGQGVDFMQKTGEAKKATWHGKAPKPEEAREELARLQITKEQKQFLDNFRKTVSYKPKKPNFPKSLAKVKIKSGTPKLYKVDTLTDCRSAYGAALLDLAKKNKKVIALTADVAGSVKTDGVKKELPNQHIECGIAEQHMVSTSGGTSLSGLVPFCSTFGAFMTSRAKDQVRVNDINETNVKMVATHSGLSVGEDGPTHQAIDDMGSMLGLYNTMVVEPADPNHTDRIIRYIASHYGNFYVRMGRHKVPVLTKENGEPFYDKNYKYEYGKCDLLRKGSSLTIVAGGSMVSEAIKARELLKSVRLHTKVEIVVASSIKKFDQTLVDSIKKTKRVITVEDHTIYSGLGNQVGHVILDKKLPIKNFIKMGTKDYQLSGTSLQLYEAAGISARHIKDKCVKILGSRE